MRFYILNQINDVVTFVRASQVNKRWKSEIDQIWKNYCYKNGLLENLEFWEEHNRNWKWVTQCALNILQISELQEDVKRAGMLTTKQCTYLGEFNGILKNGIGICIYPHGDKYTGFWKEDKYHGQGQYYYASNGCKYKGEFKDGVKEGFGVCSWKAGDIYTGEWKDGIQHGKGSHSWPGGEKYVGSWRGAKQDGFGIFSWPNGDKFEGEWYVEIVISFNNVRKEDLRHGSAVYTYQNGGKYEGGFHLDERSGDGVFYWPDGDRFQGVWLNGGRNGEGLLITKGGEKINQVWNEPNGVNYSTALPAKVPP